MKPKEEEMYKQDYLRFCNVPRTIEEVAVEFDVHVQTARRMIWGLQTDGRIREVPTKKRHKKWQAAERQSKNGELLVGTQSGVYGLGDIADGFGPGPISTVDMVSGCLAYLWRRSHYGSLSQERVENVAKQGSLDPYLHVRPVMEEVYRRSVAISEVIEFVLMGLPEIWKDTNDASAILGPIGLERQLRLEEAAEWFEQWAAGRLGDDK